MPHEAPLHCDILTDEEAIAAIEPEWHALQARTGRGFYTDYNWLLIWWRTLGNIKGRRLHVVTARDGAGRLIGLLPLCVIPKKGFRVLQAVGAEAFYFCNALCEDSWQAGVLWRAARQSPHYDFAHIRDVMPESIALHGLSRFATLRERPRTYSLRLQWSSSEAWIASLPGDFRRNYIRRIRNLNQIGAVSYHLCEAPPVNADIIRQMVSAKLEWCEKNGRQGMFDQPNVLEYWLQIAEHAARDNTLLLAWVKCGDAIIARNIMFKGGKVLYIHSLAPDPAWSKHAPGHVAIVHAISWAIDHGFELVDHRQGESDLKAKFSNQVRECPEYSFHRSLKGWVGETMFFHRRALKRNAKVKGVPEPKPIQQPALAELAA